MDTTVYSETVIMLLDENIETPVMMLPDENIEAPVNDASDSSVDQLSSTLRKMMIFLVALPHSQTQ